MLVSTTNSPQQRWLIITLVIGIHLLGGFALMMRHVVRVQPAPSLVVTLLALPAMSPPPLPAVPLATLPLPMAIMPEVANLEVAPSTAITVAIAQVTVALESPATTEHGIQKPTERPTQLSSSEAQFDVDYLNNPQPTYPSSSRRMREQGLVVIKVKVRVDGSVETLSIQQRSGSIRLDTYFHLDHH